MQAVNNQSVFRNEINLMWVLSFFFISVAIYFDMLVVSTTRSKEAINIYIDGWGMVILLMFHARIQRGNCVSESPSPGKS